MSKADAATLSGQSPLVDAAKLPSRWVIAMAGVAIQMMLGTVYAWSVFKPKIIAYHPTWTPFQVGLTFAFTIFFLGFSAALGGRLVDKAGARKVASAGGILFGLGTILGAYGFQSGSLVLLWVGYGVIGGIGNGLGYVTPVAVLTRWFPDKKGLITGMAVMGFGLGAAFMALIAQGVIGAYGPLNGICSILYISGAVFLVGILLCARLLINPPVGYTVAAKAGAPKPAAMVSMTQAQALRTPQLYIIWGILFFNVAAGIALLSNLKPLCLANFSDTLAGLVVMSGNFFNGFGRIFWGSLSEKIGRRNVFLLLFLTQIPLFILLPHISAAFGGYWAFTVVACYILLCYGGGFGTMPSFTAETFGPKNMGAIYGMVLFAWGVAGGVGPSLMEWVLAKTKSFDLALYIAAGFLGAGLILTLLYRKPKLPESQG